MASLRRVYFEALAACALPVGIILACGARPDEIGPAEGNGAGSSGLVSGSESTVDDDELGEPEVEVEVPSLEPQGEPDAGAPDAAPPAPVDEPVDEPAPVGGELAACIELVVQCTTISVAVSDEERGVCVQLSIDNCGGATRAGLPVDLPASWRLASASLGDLAEGCVPGTFDPDNVIIVDASGSISWNEETPRPTELVIDVTLEPSPVAADTEPVSVSASLASALPDCEN